MSAAKAEVRALAFVIHAIRAAWTVGLIEQHLTTNLRTRPFAEVAIDAIDAARDPSLKAPGVLLTHRAGLPECIKCSTKASTQPPKLARCGKCGRISETEHDCRAAGPPSWLPQAKQLASSYQRRVAEAVAMGDHKQADEIREQWRSALERIGVQSDQ